MNDAAYFPVASNPFSTRFTRPGAIAYHFNDANGTAGQSIAQLVEQFLAQGRRGQIVGPHGSGKSTLLVALAKEFEQRGLLPSVFTLHDNQRRLPAEFFTLSGDERRVAVIDGYEQLGRWHRWRLAWRCRQRDWGLLVTCHEPLEFPTLYRTSVNVELALRLVHEILPAGDPRIGEADVRAAFGGHQGDMRETFFTLYDDYEARRAAGSRSDA